MSTTASSHIKATSSANILMCKQWWKVCWMYGDQEKYYRQLYGRKNNNKNYPVNKTNGGAQITELNDDFLLGKSDESHHQQKRKVSSKIPSPNTYPLYGDSYLLGSSPETVYGFKTASPQTPSPRVQNVNGDCRYRPTYGDEIDPTLSTPALEFNHALLSPNGGKFERSTATVCKNGAAVIVTEEATINSNGVLNANVKFKRTSVQSSPPKNAIANGCRQYGSRDSSDVDDRQLVNGGTGRDRNGILEILSSGNGLDCFGGQAMTTTTVTVKQTAVKPCNE